MTERMPLPAKECGYAPNADITPIPADSVRIAEERRMRRKDMAPVCVYYTLTISLENSLTVAE